MCLPLKKGRQAILSGFCLDKVTADFPTYPLGNVTRGLKMMSKGQGSEVLQKSFPKMPRKVGGETDIIIGIKYFVSISPRKCTNSHQDSVFLGLPF